jgi:prophage DNA circulation protein
MIYHYAFESSSTAQMTSIQIASDALSEAAALVECAKMNLTEASKDLADANKKHKKAKRNISEADVVRARLEYFADRRAKYAMYTAGSRGGAKARRVSNKAASKAWEAGCAFFRAHSSECTANNIWLTKVATEETMRRALDQADFDHAHALHAFWRAQDACDDLKDARVLECAEEMSAGCGF